MSIDYQKMTDELVAMMGDDTLPPWRQTWAEGDVMPRSYLTGAPYRASNFIRLWIATTHYGFHSPVWIGGGEIKRLQVEAQKKGLPWEQQPQRRKGCGSEYILVPAPKKITKKDASGNDVDAFIPLFFAKNVWNMGDMLNVPAPNIEAPYVPTIREIEEALHAHPNLPAVVMSESNPHYLRSADQVRIRPIGSFESTDAYYCTLAHELAHASGHASRLARKSLQEIDTWADEAYCYEELIAELASVMISSVWGVSGGLEASASYLKHWAGYLKDNPTAIVNAATEAQKAADYVLQIDHKYRNQSDDEE